MDEGTLIELIKNSIKYNKIIFVVGKLIDINGQTAADIFSKRTKTDNYFMGFKKIITLKNSLNSPGGYVFEDKDKLVIFLQDDPGEISKMMSGDIAPLVEDKYGATLIKVKSSIFNIKLNKENIPNKKRTTNRYRNNTKRLISKKFLIIGALSLVILAVGIFYYIINL